MEKDAIRSHHNNGITNTSNHQNRSGAESTARQTASSSDFGFQWGNRKRLRCMKVQAKDESVTNHNAMNRTTIRRVVRGDKDISSSVINKQPSTTTVNNSGSHGNGYFNLRQRPSSPSILGSHRVLRNSENSSAMRGQSNGTLRRVASPTDRRGSNHHHDLNANNNNKSGGSSETAQESKKGGGSSSGSGEAAVTAAVWPPKFVIPLTNKEKEEDFFVFKGSKLPQRPKKRAKFIQRTLNMKRRRTVAVWWLKQARRTWRRIRSGMRTHSMRLLMPSPRPTMKWKMTIFVITSTTRWQRQMVMVCDDVAVETSQEDISTVLLDLEGNEDVETAEAEEVEG